MQVSTHFQQLNDEGVQQMTYMNHEGVPECESVSDYFSEVTLFRRHHFSVPMTADARRSMSFWEQRTGHGNMLPLAPLSLSTHRGLFYF